MPKVEFVEAKRIAKALDIQIKFWRIDEGEEELAALLPLHWDYWAEARSRFASAHRRLEWLASRVLFHQLFGPDDSIAYYETKRPYVRTPHSLPYTEISISHTGNVVCLACARVPIGVDIERYAPRALRLIDKFLTPEEQGLLLSGEGGEREQRAVDLWSAKEAAYKRYDRPDTELGRDFRLTADGEARLRVAPTFEAPSGRVYIARTAEFALAVCR